MLELPKNSNLPSAFKFPFKKECIEQITLNILARHDKTFLFWATVVYRNGKTSGRQEFNEKDFPSLVKAVEQFVDGMK